MKIEVSNGEIVDKLSIIEIKLERIKDEAKLVNLRNEHAVLLEATESFFSRDHELYKALIGVNMELWDIEDHIRELEKAKDFGSDFIETARSVYFKNDRRAELKRQINDATGSTLIEEKSYEDYK